MKGSWPLKLKFSHSHSYFLNIGTESIQKSWSELTVCSDHRGSSITVRMHVVVPCCSWTVKEH